MMLAVRRGCAYVQIWLINTDEKKKRVPVIESLGIISCIDWLSMLLAGCLIYARALLEYVIVIVWVRS